MVLQRVDPGSLARMGAVIYAALGFVVGAAVSLTTLLGVGLGDWSQASPVGALGGVFIGLGAVILLPLLYGFIGGVVCLVAAGLYNLAASRIGGVEIDLVMKTPDA